MHLHASIVKFYIYTTVTYVDNVGNIRKHFGNSFAVNQVRELLSPYSVFFVKMNVMFVA